ncbi:TonB-dependent receptor [Sphingomonas sp. R647]|uniref:TonB-dependent receptor domain-containing protein n=1 Tax=Sphingomonas sp. R647 TaxID=2875233 RepID=UPI001CD322C8|nr:TonB-dependent receptor [Sphingomonas sp. R647]MCA1198299.1 TonB-dependent receptor [Sphingomonas sp. R647]
MKTKIRIAGLLGSISLLATATAAIAQDAPQTAADVQDDTTEEVVVIGSQIKGADVAGALPVTVLNEDDIAAAAATSGDDLFRSIPQAGDVAFNESRDAGGINDARGDTASINLRALGTGNTLVLLNGRRMVLHPGTQSENLVPVQSVNTNTIPVMGVRRVEVLLDGAAAIYGSDAVAGVINTVLKDNFRGLRTTAEIGFTEDSGQIEAEFAFEAGHRFNGGKSNISVFGSYNHRDPLYARDRRNSRSADLRPLVAGTPFANDTDFDNTSVDSIWGEFQRLTNSFVASTTTATVNGTSLTSSGIFHIQPNTNEGCIVASGYAGTCFDNSSLSTASTDNNLKYDINDVRTIMGRNDRINLFGFFNHEFDSGIEFFAEAGWYRADFQSQREQDTALASQRLIIPANGYYNPFGPTGSAFRIPGLSGVATTGVPIELIDYRPVDAGPLVVNVRNDTTRFLAGFRGEVLGFDFDSAALYSRARTADSMRTVSLTKFQEALSRTDASAYNPFNGGDPLNPGRYDSSPNSQAIIDSFVVDIGRVSTTELAMGDFKISKNDLFTLPGGRVGMAAGVEFRHETFADDRDDRLDGTIRFVALDGSSNGSDTMGASPTPDSGGSRDTISGFLEFAVPLVAPDMNVPLIRSLDLQLAGRVESYQGFNTVAKPKVAASWYPFANFQLRGSWSQGFRAPNLPQLFENGIQRSNTRTDWVKCEADFRAGRIANFDACTRSQGVVSNRSGSQDLTPEESDSLSLGGTYQLNMGKAGRLTFTADYWEIRQKSVIGLFGDGNALILDYLLRLQGSSNPNVQRAAPTPQEILDFTGSGIAPVGRVIQVIDNYTNLSPRAVRGYDLGVYYQVKDTGIGDFSVRVNAARLLEFYQVPGPAAQALVDAQAAGNIDPSIIIAGAQDLVEQNGRPKWRASASVTWRYDGFGIGYYGGYVGEVTDTSASLADGTRFRVDDYMTHSLYAQYEVDGGPMDSLRLRVGARNLFNTLAPIADNSNGYIGDLYSNRGRQIYFSVSKRF